MITAHPKVTRSWEMVSIDLIGPLPRFTKGNQYIFVITDYFSKFVLVFALRKALTDSIVRRIEEKTFLIFGVPRIIICDNGVQFRSRQFKALMEKCTIKFTPFYHPRANPTERTNRTLETMLSMYVSDNHKKWDQELSAVACAIRTAKHDTLLRKLWKGNGLVSE